MGEGVGEEHPCKNWPFASWCSAFGLRHSVSSVPEESVIWIWHHSENTAAVQILIIFLLILLPYLNKFKGGSKGFISAEVLSVYSAASHLL